MKKSSKDKPQHRSRSSRRSPDGVAFYRGLSYRYYVDRKGKGYEVTFMGSAGLKTTAPTKAQVPLCAQEALDAFLDTTLALFAQGVTIPQQRRDSDAD